MFIRCDTGTGGFVPRSPEHPGPCGGLVGFFCGFSEARAKKKAVACPETETATFGGGMEMKAGF